jgi:hypothetical protein
MLQIYHQLILLKKYCFVCVTAVEQQMVSKRLSTARDSRITRGRGPSEAFRILDAHAMDFCDVFELPHYHSGGCLICPVSTVALHRMRQGTGKIHSSKYTQSEFSCFTQCGHFYVMALVLSIKVGMFKEILSVSTLSLFRHSHQWLNKSPSLRFTLLLLAINTC